MQAGQHLGLGAAAGTQGRCMQDNGFCAAGGVRDITLGSVCSSPKAGVAASACAYPLRQRWVYSPYNPQY